MVLNQASARLCCSPGLGLWPSPVDIIPFDVAVVVFAAVAVVAVVVADVVVILMACTCSSHLSERPPDWLAGRPSGSLPVEHLAFSIWPAGRPTGPSPVCRQRRPLLWYKWPLGDSRRCRRLCRRCHHNPHRRHPLATNDDPFQHSTLTGGLYQPNSRRQWRRRRRRRRRRWQRSTGRPR